MSNIFFKKNYSSSDSSITYSPSLVQIYFNTATYVEVEKDRKVTLEAQLGVIGGTMGLLTGFSILSAMEIIYYIVRILMTPNQRRIGPNTTMVHSSSSY